MGLFDKKTKSAEEEVAEIKEVKAVKTPKVAKPVKAVTAKNGDVFGVLVSPLVTEKSTKEEQLGKYVFAVTESATKSEVIKAVATRYGVKPVKVNIMNRLGKVKRTGAHWGKRKNWRKAVITLPKGKSINVYDTNK